MEIIEKPDYNPDLALALGFFDGVHIAHQTLIKKTVDFSRKNGIKSAVITFMENPLCDLGYKNINYIYSNEDKFKIIEEMGVDYLYVLKFSDFSHLEAKDYLKDVLVKNFSPKFITTGFNHYFGKNKTGNDKFLSDNSQKYGYIYEEVPPIEINSVLVSTTNIKKMISKGDIKGANEFLGRDFFIKGEVIKGNNIGEKLGFRTANLKWSDDIIKLPYGVYKTECLFEGEKYNAIANWGICPTINKKEETLEVHILGFDKNIYGKELKVFFTDKIRDEKKFNSKEELQEQIKKDLSVF